MFDYLLERLPPLPDRDDDWLETDARALTEYLRSTDGDPRDVDGPTYRFSSPGQKYALVTRILERLAQRRSVLVWLDDLQWGAEALGWLEHLADLDRERPDVLVVATVRSDLLDEQPRLSDRLDAIQSEDFSTSLQLTPLPRHHQRELLTRLLPLEEALADRLAERTEGHPLFAMQLLGHWIDADVIEVGPDGFRVAEGHELVLPGDIHDLWQRRLDRFIDAFPSEEPEQIQRAIEVAAALGREVDGEEWGAVCDGLEIDHPDSIRDGLVERGLAERTEHGWAFAHGLIADSLERRAREHDRWRGHHRRCADLLESLHPDHPKQTAARRADHRIEARELAKALEPLLVRAQTQWESGEPQRARNVLEHRRKILDRLEIPEGAPQSIESSIAVAKCDLLARVPPDSVLASLEAARERAANRCDDRLQASAWCRISECHREMADWAAAREAARKATRRARLCGEPDVLIEALIEWGSADYLRGDLDGAEQRFSEARTRAREAGDRFYKVSAQRSIAWVVMARGNTERAASLLDDSLQASRDAGFRRVEMGCLNMLGEIARFRGDAETARNRYRQFARLAREAHLLEDVAMSHLNLAQVQLMAGNVDEAEPQLLEADQRLEKLDRKSKMLVLLRLVRLTLASGKQSWACFDELFSDYADGWPEDARLIKDHPWLLEMAGDYAAEAGERERATRAWQLSRDLWNRLGDDEARDRIADKIDE